MKTVIEMAREAGFLMENSAAIQAAERFAELVRADEREQCLHAAEVAASLLNDPIAAIKQARSALVQSCYCPNCEALSKELAALKAQPTVPLTDDWIRSKCKQTWVFETAKQWVRMTEEAHGITAAPVQEPVAWHDKIIGMEVSMDVSTGDDDIDHRVYGQVYEVMLAYDGGPDVILAIESERNFTTPPAQPAPVQGPVAWMHWLYRPCRLFMNKDEAMMELDRLNREYPVDGHARKMRPLVFGDTTPPAAQRQWVGLTEEEVAEGLRKPFWEDAARAIEAKLKEKNNG